MIAITYCFALINMNVRLSWICEVGDVGRFFDATKKGESVPSSYHDLAGEPGLEKEEFPTSFS